MNFSKKILSLRIFAGPTRSFCHKKVVAIVFIRECLLRDSTAGVYGSEELRPLEKSHGADRELHRPQRAAVRKSLAHFCSAFDLRDLRAIVGVNCCSKGEYRNPQFGSARRS